MELADQEARALYSKPGVREYLRERVQVELLDTSEAVEAYCYNLPRGIGPGRGPIPRTRPSCHSWLRRCSSIRPTSKKSLRSAR
jgi:hypothetical protein